MYRNSIIGNETTCGRISNYMAHTLTHESEDVGAFCFMTGVEQRFCNSKSEWTEH